MTNVIPLFAKRRQVEGSSSAGDVSLSDAQQLSLPFGVNPIAYVYFGNAALDGGEFLQFLGVKNVAVFFDLRLSPRLDFIAPSRKAAFEALKRLSVEYADVFGRAGISSPASALDDKVEILKEIVVYSEKMLTGGRSCLIVFDSAPIMTEYQALMGKYFDILRLDEKYVRDVAAEVNKLEM